VAFLLDWEYDWRSRSENNGLMKFMDEPVMINRGEHPAARATAHGWGEVVPAFWADVDIVPERSEWDAVHAAISEREVFKGEL
jgi:hypothetical protein